MSMYSVSVNGKEYEVGISSERIVTVVGVSEKISVQSTGAGTHAVLVGKASMQIVAQEADGNYQVLLGGNQVDVIVETERDRLLRKYAISSSPVSHRLEIHAPMPALVVRVVVNVGDRVNEGQGLVILEAMKMENEIRSHRPGTVKEIYVAKGKPVEKGELLMLLE